MKNSNIPSINSDIKKEIENLIQIINRLNYEYYVLNNSSVSDLEYDKYMHDLKNLEKNYPKLIKKNSPTQKVGSSISINNFEKIKHEHQMYSLDNAFNLEELFAFDNRVKKLLNTQNDIEYLAEMKIDGLSLNLKYVAGKLIMATTRGDGIVGENIYINIFNNNSIPKNISNKNSIEIRGEIVFIKQDFIAYKNAIIDLNNAITKYNLNNNKLSIPDKLVPANARNAAAGLVRYINANKGLASNNWAIKKFAEIKMEFLKKLRFYAYQIPDAQQINLFTQIDVLKFLENNGFNINQNYHLSKNINDIKIFLDKYESKLKTLEFEADGIVIKVNNLNLYKILGYTNKSPRWAIAFKYQALEKITTLKNIFVTIGRTGKVTYNAKVEPIEIMGSTITFATLHNYDYVSKLNLNIGCQVKIIKSGGIIPKVIGKVKANNDNSTFPKIINCPICDSKLIQKLNQVDDYCINLDCPSIIKHSLIQFCQKDAMDIIGLGDKLIEICLEKKVITSIKDLYILASSDEIGHKKQKEFLIAISNNKNNILKPENSKTIAKIILSIQNSKSHSLERLLYGLGIANLGIKFSKLLAMHFLTLDNLINASIEKLLMINGIGNEVAKSIIDFFALESNKRLIEFLRMHNLNFQYISNKIIDVNNIFYKKNFLITGSFQISRSALKTLIENKGGNFLSSVSKNLDYLVVGENPGSKLKKAQELNIKIINEHDLNNHL